MKNMTEKPVIGFKKLHVDAVIPRLATPGSAGADLHAMVLDADGEVSKEGIVILPLARVLVPTGLAMDIPEGYEVQLRPRSGLALKHGLTLVNSPATLDSDYSGPVGMIFTVLGHEPFTMNHLDRVAQMVVAPVCGFTEKLVTQISESERGAGGFGSTGI
jgi:dUTP pyrophosphatase